MKRSSDSTHHCRSPTPTLNGCDLTPSTRTQSSEQEYSYSYLTASMGNPSTPYSRNTPESFSQRTRPYTFPISTKHVYTSLACPRISRKFSGEWKFVLQCHGRDENRGGYHPALVPLFSRHLGMHLSLGG